MRELGVHLLIAFCLNDTCRHRALIDVSSYPDDVEVPWFRSRVKRGKCGGKRVDAAELEGATGDARQLESPLSLGKVMVRRSRLFDARSLSKA
jgi:hypothetical protein